MYLLHIKEPIQSFFILGLINLINILLCITCHNQLLLKLYSMMSLFLYTLYIAQTSPLFQF